MQPSVSCFLSVVFLLGFFAVSVLADEPDFSAKPQKGKQIAQKIELPKSTSTWKKKKDQPLEATFSQLATSKPVDPTQKEDVRFWLFLPADYDESAAAKSWPLLLFLHGRGEWGKDMAKVKVHGPPKYLDSPNIQEQCPFIVVSPQCEEEYCWSAEQLLLLLDELEKTYKVDKSRIYATGLSMGGFGSWLLAETAPERFAAVAPVCGGADVAQAGKLVDLPIWAFHGEKDSVVPVALSKEMVEAVRASGGQKAKITLYPEADHDSWSETYKNGDLYDWLLKNRKP